ncbi:MAG: hypothetical protein AAF438_16515, partial [Pseudomonadota bacterium]
MLQSIPQQRDDGWAVTTPDRANFAATFLPQFNRWLDENYEYHNTHAVLVEHAGKLAFERYLDGQDLQFNE